MTVKEAWQSHGHHLEFRLLKIVDIQQPTHFCYQCMITGFEQVTTGHHITELMETLSTLAQNQ